MIQSGLSEQQFEAAMRFANKWREEMEQTGYSWKGQTRGGWKSELRRHAYGYLIKVNGASHPRHVSCQADSSDLVFRRISVRRRIFGIVKESEIEITKVDPSNVENSCKCPSCTRLEKYGWVYGEPPEMYMLFEFGEIKGQ